VKFLQAIKNSRRFYVVIECSKLCAEPIRKFTTLSHELRQYTGGVEDIFECTVFIVEYIPCFFKSLLVVLVETRLFSLEVVRTIINKSYLCQSGLDLLVIALSREESDA